MASSANSLVPVNIIEDEIDSAYQLLTLDPSHLLYLHPSDHPGQILVTQTLTGDNFNQWRRSMTLALSAKNKLGIITGKLTVPSANSQYLIHWQRCNDMVITWLLNSISPEITSSIVYIPYASEIWTDLHTRFTQNNGSRLYEIKKDIAQLTQVSRSVSAYYTKFKTLWDELSNLIHIPKCTCNCKCGAIKNFKKQMRKL